MPTAYSRRCNDAAASCNHRRDSGHDSYLPIWLIGQLPRWAGKVTAQRPTLVERGISRGARLRDPGGLLTRRKALIPDADHQPAQRFLTSQPVLTLSPVRAVHSG